MEGNKIKKCQCGSIIIETKKETYPMSEEFFSNNFEQLNVPSEIDYVHCDYCINGYGLNLCACGSGEEYNKCENNYKECGTPMMIFGEVKPRGGWNF